MRNRAVLCSIAMYVAMYVWTIECALVMLFCAVIFTSTIS